MSIAVERMIPCFAISYDGTGFQAGIGLGERESKWNVIIDGLLFAHLYVESRYVMEDGG